MVMQECTNWDADVSHITDICTAGECTIWSRTGLQFSPLFGFWDRKRCHKLLRYKCLISDHYLCTKNVILQCSTRVGVPPKVGHVYFKASQLKHVLPNHLCGSLSETCSTWSKWSWTRRNTSSDCRRGAQVSSGDWAPTQGRMYMGIGRSIRTRKKGSSHPNSWTRLVLVTTTINQQQPYNCSTRTSY